MFYATPALLFCFLFQSNEFAGSNILDLPEDENLQPVYEVLQKELEVTVEESIVESMNQVFYGAIGVIQQDRT